MNTSGHDQVKCRDYIASYVDSNKKHVVFIPGLERLSRRFNAISLGEKNGIPSSFTDTNPVNTSSSSVPEHAK